MEDSIKNELAKAVRLLEEEKKKLKDLKDEKNKCMSEMGSKTFNGITVEKMRTYNAYISFLKEKIKKQTEKVKLAQEIVDKYREELIQFAKERKMLETLKEKQYQNYLKEQQRIEQRRIDEVITYKESLKHN